ncbi:MAG: sulfur oxidation c-type cytochrome SoxA [Kiloniellaceae bacterium]
MTLQRCLAICCLQLCVIGLAGAEEIPAAGKRSGLDFVSPETRSLQEDDTSNPGMLWVLDGERLWREGAGPSGAACADCHGDASESMRGVAARYPAFDAASGLPLDLQGRINACRAERQGVPPSSLETQELLSLSAFVAHQSRGMPVAPAADERLIPFIEGGRSLYHQRLGQLDIACADCHDDRWGQRLSGSVIPQAHPTGYPVYRLEWQTLGSLQRRLRNCMIGVRAEPFPYGAPEFVELELFLMQRAAGLPIETPGVRP